MNETMPIRQTKFSNGMISRALFGETSHPKYGASLRSCLNWIPTPTGALVKRPGFKFVAPVKDESYAPRLIKFFFSDNQTFVLEVGNLYIRFYRQGRYVGVDGALHTYGDAYVGGYYEVVTPFTVAMLPYLKFAQVGDTITFSYGGQAVGVAAVAPRDLLHTSGALTPWTIGLTPLKIPAGVVTWPSAPTIGIVTFTFTGATTGIQWTQGQRAYWLSAVAPTAGAFAEWIAIQQIVKGSNQQPPDPFTLNTTSTSVAGNLWWMPAVDLAHPAVMSRWVETAVVQNNTTGVVYESDPSLVLEYTSSLGQDRQLPIGITQANVAAGYTLLFYRLYRATSGGIFGLVNDVLVGNLTQYPGTTTPVGNTLGFYLDDGRSPDYTRQPPKGTDPFLIGGTDSFPAVIGYLDQRRLWAGQAKLPSSLLMSKIGDLYNYDGSVTKLIPGADTDGMQVLLASEVLEQVRSFVPMRRGLILTAQGEWAIAGQGGAPVSRSNVDPKRQSKWGSSWLNPIGIGTGILFNTAKSNMVRDLYPLYGLYNDIWDGQDLTVLTRDLFNLHTLSDWDFQSVPYPVVWAVRDDRTLLSLTYQHAPPSFGQQLAEGICAWAKHTTGADTDGFESVCVVPEPPDDALYAVVRRTPPGAATRRYIERAENPICSPSPYIAGVSDVRYGKYLDSFVVYDGHNDQIGYTGTPALVDSVANPGSVALADYAVGSQVYVNIAGGPFVASDAANPYGSAFVFDPENLLGLNPPALDPNTGLPTGQLIVVSGRVLAFVNSTKVMVEFDAPMTAAQITAWRAGQARWAIAKGQVQANSLLSFPLDTNDANLARGVICLADGDVQLPAAWAGGTAFLTTPAVVVTTGYAYNADVELLDAWHQSAEIRNRFKEVIRVGFEIADTRGMWAGKDLTDLSELVEREVVDEYAVMGLHTGYFEVYVNGGFSKSGAAALRHFQPLPATLASVLREIRLGDT